MDSQQKQSESSFLILALSTVVLGLAVGLAAMLLSFFLENIEAFFLNFHESTANPGPAGTWPWRRLISVTIGGIIAAGAWWAIRRPNQPKIVGIKGALAGKRMPVLGTIVHVVTQIFYVGTGGSVGRELAPRQAGVLLGQIWQRILDRLGWRNLSAEDEKLLLAAAAGAGFAGVYIAPITGMLFSVEMLVKKTTMKTVSVSMGMAMIAMLVGSIAKGFHPYYLVGDGKFSVTILFIATVIGPLAGVFGAIARKAFAWAEKTQVQSAKIFAFLPAMALITGIVAFFTPDIMGNGRALAQGALNAESGKVVIFLLILAVLKLVITFATLKAGGSGGTLTPAIATGAVLGLLVGAALHIYFPSIPLWQSTALGAAAFLAASQEAPLMALFMIFEISHLESSALLPLAWVVTLSAIASRIYLKLSKK
ncbi:chloride channel protein [Eupransor demetentiae]|uniref:H+/Cl- antiporter ClcA (ClcA) n=1 Tax=Eupransor demetentiae TaxID=3109584 RepID=A0ABP0ERC1_9LACO|nr:H+/Cl- antiporter ClcA (ClcA) [Lactobacillaceae bacterium LMG 33000]